MPMSSSLIIDGALQSVMPPARGFGFNYHADLVPPFKPKSVLILGYGMGTLAGLIKKIYRNVYITGVDIEDRISDTIFKIQPNSFILGDASSVIKELRQVDYIAIDIFNGSHIPGFVFSEVFIQDVCRLNPKLVGINTIGLQPESEMMREWDSAMYLSFWKQNSRGNTVFFFTPEAASRM